MLEVQIKNFFAKACATQLIYFHDALSGEKNVFLKYITNLFKSSSEPSGETRERKLCCIEKSRDVSSIERCTSRLSRGSGDSSLLETNLNDLLVLLDEQKHRGFGQWRLN